MKNLYQPGDIKTYVKTVEAADMATFESGTVHEVYATFAIARDAEWAGRLFVLDMKDTDEEGIGTLIEVRHHGPALLGSTVLYTATVEDIHKNSISCTFTAHCGDRLIASGRTGQKILKRDKLDQLFSSL